MRRGAGYTARAMTLLENPAAPTSTPSDTSPDAVWLFVAAVGVILVAAMVRRLRRAARPLPYTARPYLLSRGEAAFFLFIPPAIVALFMPDLRDDRPAA